MASAAVVEGGHVSIGEFEKDLNLFIQGIPTFVAFLC
jgi:hypothetical protein